MSTSSRHLLYNQDCTTLFMRPGPVTPRHVDEMVDEVADAGVDLLLLNVNLQRVNYASSVWQTLWDGYVPGQREFFGPVPEDEIPLREGYVSKMRELHEMGCDYVAHSLARCRSRGIGAGISLRMNDMHDYPWPGSHLYSDFYKDNPRFRLQNPAHLGWATTGLDYTHIEVREHYLDLIRELVARYDFDTLELDFLRFPEYFPRDGAYEAHAAIMTAFVLEVRQVLNEAATAVELICRVASTPCVAFELGFDLRDWAQRGLIDGVTASAFFNTSWQIPVDAFREVLGAQVSFYVSTEASADNRIGYPTRWLPLEGDLLNGFAAGYLAAGVDGIALFNFFVPREEDPTCHLRFENLPLMKSLALLQGVQKTYLISAGISQMETDGEVLLPLNIEAAQSRGLSVWMGAESYPAEVTLEVIFVKTSEMNAIWVSVNDKPVGPATLDDVRAMNVPDSCIASVVFEAGRIRDGRNSFVIRNEGDQVRIVGIEIRVAPREGSQ